MRLLTVWINLVLLFPESFSGIDERRLLEELFTRRGHNKLERPVSNDSESLLVLFGLTLQQIIEVDEKNQIINTNIWLNINWNDSNLSWNESEYAGIKSVRIPTSMLWKPDILMYNSADEDIDSTFPANVVLGSAGTCLWVPPGLFRSTCKIDITWFPFDDQRCKLKFGSWTYDKSGIDLRLKEKDGDVSSFIENGEWQLIELYGNRNVLSYECCPEQYIDLTFTIHIRRRTLYYGFNLIIPCVLISSMTLLTFALPPDAGEKISLGVTVLLSLTVFLLLVAETMPPTSDAVPLIGMYFSAIMLMCSISVVCTVLVLNLHHRTPRIHTMPNWIRFGICVMLAWILRMKRPNQKKKCQPTEHKRSYEHRMTNANKIKLKNLDLLPAKSSKSLLANVIDLEYELKCNRNTVHLPPPLWKESNLMLYGAAKFSTNGLVYANDANRQLNRGMNVIDGYNHAESANNYFKNGGFNDTTGGFSHYDVRNSNFKGDANCAIGNGSSSRLIEFADNGKYATDEQLKCTATCFKEHVQNSNLILKAILDEMRTLTNNMKDEETDEDQRCEWKFAAMVVDRACLCLFTLSTFVSTFAILFSAPHILA